MAQYIRSQLGAENSKKIRTYFFNSVRTETRVGTFESFGREEVLDQIFETLWSDIAHKIAAEYANELHSDLYRICNGLDSACSATADRLRAYPKIKWSELYSFRGEEMEEKKSYQSWTITVARRLKRS